MARPNPVARPRSGSTSMSAPIGGLNVRDAIQSMPTNDAVELVNWIAQQYGVRSRKGYKEWCTNLGGAVRSVMVYQPDRQDLTNFKLFGVTDTAIKDVTSNSSAPPTVLSLPGTDNYGYFASTMMANTAGTFLLCCSHEGGYRYYNGTAWTTPTFGTGAGQIGGINPSNIVFVTTWKRRVWFIEKNSARVWYLPTDAITGTAVMLDLGPFMRKGGKLSFIANWTIDAGEGIDDFIVFGSENGEILIYKGTNPDSASSFGLQGIYYVGALPIGRRAFVEMGGDVLILSELGIQPLSYVTRGGQSLLRASSVDYLAKIQPRLAELVPQFANSLGWSMIFFPRENLMIVSVPAGAISQRVQYALYTNTNTWSQMNGMPMNGAMCIANNQLFFGSDDGKVYLGYEGYFDDVPLGSSVGNGIYGKIQPAYSYFGKVGANKHFMMVRPVFMATDRPSVVVTMLTDFQVVPPAGNPVASAPTGSRWDISRWDEGVWAGALNVYQDWYGAEALGYTGSVVLDTTCPGDTFLASIDYTFEYGGVL